MWYEILPSAAIIFAALSIPPTVGPWINWLAHNKHKCKKDWDCDLHDYWMYHRDRRLTGSEYKPRGLESIPDKLIK